MENFLEELNLQREATKRNIEKAFGNDIEKARSGVYADTAENRKLQRVGQHYGESKQEQPTAGQPRAKKQEEQPHQRNAKPTEQKNKGKIKDPKRADAFMKMSNEEREQIRAIFHLANWKNVDLSTIRVSKPQDGWRTITAAGNEIGKVKADDISDEVLKKIDWAADEGGENKGNAESNTSNALKIISKHNDSSDNKRGEKDLKKVEQALNNFFKKNPDANFDDKTMKLLVELPANEVVADVYSDVYDKKFGKFDGINELKESLNNFYNGSDEGDKGNGYNKEALEKFKKNKVREYYNNWNKDTDMFVSKNKKYWEKTLKKEMGVDSYDDFEDADDWKKYNKAVKIALNAIPAEKWAELADDDEKEKLKKEPKNKTASSLSQEEKAKKKSIRNKRNVIRALKTEVSGGKHLDSFLNENTEYFKDVLKKYSDDNVKDIYDLQEWLENRYENDEKDPYGYGRYDEIIYECLEKIPAEKFDNFNI